MANFTLLYAVPVYFSLAMVPHGYSVYYLATHKRGWQNDNPRGSRFSQSVTKSLSADQLAKYERCRAAHSNMMENTALFIGAVLAGCMMRLDGGFLNKMMGLYFASRVVYLACYITIEKQVLSFMRTAAFNCGLGVLFVVYVRAGQKLVEETR